MFFRAWREKLAHIGLMLASARLTKAPESYSQGASGFPKPKWPQHWLNLGLGRRPLRGQKRLELGKDEPTAEANRSPKNARIGS